MSTVETIQSIKIPNNVAVKVEGRVVTINSEKGTLSRDFSHASVSINLEGDTIIVQTSWPHKKEASLVGTVSSHIQNMIKGVTRGFTYKLKIVFSHFPITVKVKERTTSIENFTGERSPRVAKIIGDTKVFVKEDDVIAQGINLEDVAQTAANIEQATKIRRKDSRVFLDGVYIYERHEGMES